MKKGRIILAQQRRILFCTFYNFKAKSARFSFFFFFKHLECPGTKDPVQKEREKTFLPPNVGEGLENSWVSGGACSCKSVRNQQSDCVSPFHNLSEDDLAASFCIDFKTRPADQNRLACKKQRIIFYTANKKRQETMLI